MAITAKPGLSSCRRSHCAHLHPVTITQGKSQPSLRQLLEWLCWGTKGVRAKGSPATAFCSSCTTTMLSLKKPGAAPCWGGCVNPCLALFCTCSLTCKSIFFPPIQGWNWFMKMGHLRIWGCPQLPAVALNPGRKVKAKGMQCTGNYQSPWDTGWPSTHQPHSFMRWQNEPFFSFFSLNSAVWNVKSGGKWQYVPAKDIGTSEPHGSLWRLVPITVLSLHRVTLSVVVKTLSASL